ncbi:MAG: hypothetical protein HY613_03370, partial [Candidatus Rokubacteria bacterium]|nr:hypothetical protein [Candidatus Rokubacteria bacterium]
MTLSQFQPRDAGEPLILHQSAGPGETEYRVGCSSWLDPSLLSEGNFYPARRMTAEERLQWYARFFE